MAKTRYSEESEKSIERYLVERARECGALALKYYNPYSTGWPDRVVLMPHGQIVWVELKSRGEKPRPLQAHRAACLRDRGHRIYTCDTKEMADRMSLEELTGATMWLKDQMGSDDAKPADDKKKKQDRDLRAPGDSAGHDRT